MNRAQSPLFALVALLSLTSVACVAVYPELDTRVSPILKGQRLEPGPPEGILWVRIVSGHLPDRTRDGRPWKAAFGKTPDPYAKLFINGREVLRTPVESNTLEPTWPKAPHGNFKLAVNDKLRVELWDANPINDAPIGVRELGRLTAEQILDKKLDAELDGGARVVIVIEPAHAVSGVGLWYEIRTNSVFITRLLGQSPAERAGLHPGDEVLTIGGRDVHGMQADEVRSHFNAIPFDGLKLQLRRVDTTRTDVVLKEGPIYPTFDKYGSIDEAHVRVPPFGLPTEEIKDELAALRCGMSVAVCRAKNPFNVGAIIRVAHSFLVREIFLVGTEPYYERAAMGMTKYENIVACEDEATLLDAVRGRPLIGVERDHATTTIWEAEMPKDLVFLFGSEDAGLPPELLAACDRVVAIPMYGINHSYPVAIAAGMVLCEWARRRDPRARMR